MNAKGAKVLFFAESLTLCHLTRPLVLASALRDTDYEVHVACRSEHHRLYDGLSVQLHHLDSVPSAQSLARVDSGKPVFATNTLRRYVDEDVALIRELAPAAVVGDMRLSLSVSARLTETPYLCIVNAYWSPFARPRFDAPELPITRLVGPEIMAPFVRALLPLAFALHCRPLNAVRREHGLPSLGGDLRRVYTDADVTLYADASEFIPAENLPRNHRYLGPILWSHEGGLPDWWGSEPPDRQCIYVSLGSSGRSQLLQQVFDALADLPVLVMAGTSGRASPQHLPENVWVADYLPAVEASRRARMVISHGGSAPAYVALSQSTPVLGIPSNLDQHLTMHYIEQVGAGRRIRAERASAQRIRNAVEEMLSDDSYRVAAAKIANVFARYDTGRIFREILESVTSNGF